LVVLDIIEATERYEVWLGQQIDLVSKDLATKHRLMADDPFTFFRGTFYRWIERWPAICPDLDGVRGVPSTGDVHVENFGTWRDVEARLVWGINDFDEAWVLPYTQDLVRLAASAILAVNAAHLHIGAAQACTAILDGYRHGLADGGHPWVLAERHAWLRQLALSELRDPVLFWHRMNRLPRAPEPLPDEAAHALRHALPAKEPDLDVRQRTAGVGSLGRPRLVALALVAGAAVAREAKATGAPACALVRNDKKRAALTYTGILGRAVRSPDPFVGVDGGWLVRRLAPDCGRIPLAALPAGRDERRLLRAMGYEVANVHLADRAASRDTAADLERRPESWLEVAAKRMVEDVHKDWETWRHHHDTTDGQ
jgi:hypothetical protein